MRDLGALWKHYQANPDLPWAYEKRVIIDGDIYHELEIIDFAKTGSLISDDFIIGTCQSVRFDVTVSYHRDVIIPPRAKVELQIRIVDLSGDRRLYDSARRALYDSAGRALYFNPTNHTPWITFGTYYIDYRKRTVNQLSLECCDAMIFTNEEFMKARGIIDDYPMSASKMLNLISKIINVPLDERNIIRDDVFVTQISTKLTIREILGFIAASHGGSFCITDENKLRLVTVKNDKPLFNITHGLIKNKTESASRRYDKLYMVFNDTDDYYEAGTGEISLEVVNLFATKAITERVYNQIKDYTYNTFNIKSADINPALELGDPVDINGVQCNLWNYQMNSRLYFDIFAPTKGDTVREFVFKGTQNNAIRRQLASVDEQFSSMQLTLENFIVEIGANYYNRQQIDGIITTTSANLISSFEVGLSNLRYDVSQTYSTRIETVNQIGAAETRLNSSISETETRLSSSFNAGLNGLTYRLNNEFYTRTETTQQIGTAVTSAENRLNAVIETTETRLSTEFNVGLSGLQYFVEENYSTSTEVNGQITSTANILRSELTITATEFNTRVGNSQNFTQLKQTVDGFDFTGIVRFSNLYDGTTTISGNNIKTGTIDASIVNVVNLQINNVLYGNYPVITATGPDTFPHIIFGQSAYFPSNIVFNSQRYAVSSNGIVLNAIDDIQMNTINTLIDSSNYIILTGNNMVRLQTTYNSRIEIVPFQIDIISPNLRIRSSSDVDIAASQNLYLSGIGNINISANNALKILSGTLGFYGANPIYRQHVYMDWSNAQQAVWNIMAALDNLGLIYAHFT